MSAVEGKSVQDDGSSVYSRTPSIEKPDDPESRGNGGGADELSPPISGCLCCEVSNGNQEVIGDCEKEKANDHSAKGKEKEPSCCSADGTCSKSKIRPPSLSSQITEDDNGLDSCCSGKATVWPTYSIGQPCPSISDENACCKADGEYKCLVEYAAQLCAMDDRHSEDLAGSPQAEDCCTREEYRDNSLTLPRQCKGDFVITRSSLPENSELPSRHNRKPTETPCMRHLRMASEHASDTEPKGEDRPFSTFSGSAKAVEVSSKISNIVRRCFCRGPRRLVFLDGKSCCTQSRERKKGLEDVYKSMSTSSKPSTDNKIYVTATACEPAPEIDIEKGNVDKLYVLSLGVVGMTCTGCETKLRNLLNSYVGVSLVRTSFMLNRADLVYDSCIVSDPTEITSRIKKVTGFTCTILRTGLAATDVAGERIRIRNLDLKGLDILQRIDGVSHVVPLRDGTYETFYNPQTIGVRDMLDMINAPTDTYRRGHAELAPDSSSEEIAQATAKSHWLWLAGRTIVAAIFTIPVLVFAWAPVARYAPFPKQTSFVCSSLVLATVVQLLAIPIYKHAFRSLIYQKEIDMDVLVVLSITSAYIYSVVSFALEIRLSTAQTVLGHPIFETSSLLITLILLGRLMAAWVRRKAQNAIKLGTSQQKSALVVRKASPKSNPDAGAFLGLGDNQPELIDSSLLHYGDIIQGKASENIVTDGIVVSGSAEIDEAHITGEHEPVIRSRKAYVYAGSTIINGQINYRVTRLVSENTLSIVKRFVSTAASSRTRTLERADLTASYLTPIILAVACIAFLIWAFVNRFVRNWSSTESAVNALTHAIAILAISCPCALALAVPMVLTVASTVGTKKGVLFKAGAALETGCKITDVVFDKTGTLTSGELAVLCETLFCEESGQTCQEISRMAATVTRGNRHPVSLAITQYVASNYGQTNNTPSPEVDSKIIIGKGVEITTEKGTTLKGGSPSWLGVETHPKVKELLDASLTTFCVARNDTLLAVYGLTSTIRPEAAAVLQKLHSKRITTHLLSGDNPLAVRAVAAFLNFNTANVHSLCQPDSKAAYIRDLQTTSMVTPPPPPPLGPRSLFSFFRLPRLRPPPSSQRKVLFIGDGTNDAPALTQADLGICMTNATDIAADAADVGILSGSLDGLLAFLDLSQQATRRIQLNIAWAVLYNVFAVLFAAGAFEAAGFRIEPSYAGAGEIVSLLPVVLVSLSLSLWGRRR
ncbi:cation transport ATPase [Histoplasma capsulatum G186AR]|uniref:Cation transport ATPase n=1 Tax=Ajellomyces capsulatus (strain G186AR / H82 / ATCC MYA-2454 / RMSCC 2432) TaxID=447093 RepID=C0NPK1_AJECG|nr:cation transport ATPase [Histoplasma capsulatum G186AR]EEH06861.1 cation transport ATPase [Histoplasma capsulatum G186AR]